MSAQLMLPPEPRSVRRARRWVGEELTDLGREDLVDAAQLGVSELVTNAILHAATPIAVFVRGTRRHPRIEVHDSSARPPSVAVDLTGDDMLLRTVGRGLGIVALYSTSWGADVSDDGKVVWFEPAEEPGADVPAEGALFDLSGEPDPVPGGPTTTIRLIGMPVQVFAAFRVWYAEIRRELRILALAHPDDYPVDADLSALTLRVERERRLVRGIDRLDAAISAGETQVDLEYQVPLTAPATMGRVADVLDRADEFCRVHRLLTMPASPPVAAMRHWYLGEFVRQGAGEPPLPWTGPTGVDDPPAPAPAPE